MGGRRLALLIATYEYRDAGLRRLTAPAHDTEALAAVLQDPDIAGFEVTMLINEPHHRVGEAIGDLYQDRRRDDLTLLYFTGHGLKDDDGRLYLAMANTRRDSLLFTSLPAEQIDQAMSGCVSRQKVLILDCCYSGAFPATFGAGRVAKADTAVHTLERFRGRGRTVLTASDATQYSFEGDRPHGSAAQSVFTRHLVEGLREGSADLDGDGNITLDELYSHVHDRVVEEMPQQRPKKQDSVEGRIVIARNVNWSLPAHLSHALDSPIADSRLAAVDGLAHLYRIGNAFVRQYVITRMRGLVDDDSRSVSAAAAQRLEELLGPDMPEAGHETGPAPTQTMPVRPEPAPAEPLPGSAPAARTAAQVQAAPSHAPGGYQPERYGQPAQYGQQGRPGPVAGQGQVAIDCKYFPLFVLVRLVKPQITINGWQTQGQWGRNAIPLPPGRHHLQVHLPYILSFRVADPSKIGRAALAVAVQAGQTVELEYRVPMTNFNAGALGPPPQKWPGMGLLIALVTLAFGLGFGLIAILTPP